MMNDPITRRNMLAGAAMIGAAAVAHARQPQPIAKRMAKGTIEKLIPTTIGGWKFETTSGLVLPPPDAYLDRLYDEVMTRVYSRPESPPIMLLIAYGSVQDGLLQLHRPEVCYPVGGYQLTQTRIENFDLSPQTHIPIRTFTAASPSRVEQVMYWTRVGSVMPTSWAQQRWAVVRANLAGDIPDGILVRVSAVDGNIATSMALMQSFVRDLAAVVPASTQRLLWHGVA